MTRATLLHVLERPTALGPAEVRELELLAQTFPYCQTAHLLLAKAAHDQGTMLAGQRLRRAATYAADRTLLRRLIEQVEPAEPATAPEPIASPAAPHPLDLVDWPDEYAPPVAPPTAAPLLPAAAAVPARPETAPAAIVAAPLPAEEAPPPVAAIAAPPAVVAPLPAPPPLPNPAPVAFEQPLAVAASSAVAAPLEPAPATIPVAEASVANIAEPAVVENHSAATSSEELPADVAPVPTVAEVATPPSVAEAQPTETTAAALPVELAAPVPTEPLAVPTAAVAEPALVTETPLVPTEPTEVELPPQAPAIRPPVEVGEARFEFGLADPTPAPAPAYELPGLVDEWAASAVTRSLGNPDALAAPLAAPAVPVFTPAAFTGDAVVGYAFGESSRLGLAMQLLDLLTAKAEAAESATAVVAAAQPPAVPLPPTGTFFEPDPLLLDHWATHRPAVPELPSTVDLINNFLKRQPRLTRPAMLPPAPGGQTDLSVRSTRAEPDLVSENLARIFVRQGKTARAIEIYEKLMVKQPEKMAYFAAQIQSLQPSA